MSVRTVEQLLGLSPKQLDSLYRQCPPAPVPRGKVRGRAILFPGTAMARPASKAARAIWQGKVFELDGTSAVNRFFGLRMIRGEVYQGLSWMDGQPALILDYGRTSYVYARYRDEIRQVADGLYLGVMYDRTKATPDVQTYFALQSL